MQDPLFMQQAFDEVQTWTNDNSVNLNPPKTKEMLTLFATTNPSQITRIQINGEACFKSKKYPTPCSHNII